jgi:hypothetical protein
MRPPRSHCLFVRLTLSVRRLGMVVRSLRMAASLRRFFLSLRVFAFAMMRGGRFMALRSVFVVFRRLGMGFCGHASLPWFEMHAP